MRRNQKRGLSRVQAGGLLVAFIVILTYLGFTKSIPFLHHFEVKADFKTSNNLHKNSFVRIAGVNVGKVTDVQPIHKGQEGVRVTMRIDDNGQPIHKDATASIRPRIFLEGNFFVDLHPGTPSSPKLGDGDTIPATNTSTPVQLDQILTSLQADTRTHLQTLLDELSTGLSGKGAIGYNKSIQYWLPAFKNSAIVNDATLGTETHDLSRYIKRAGEVARALDSNPPALKSLITDFNTTAAAFAVQQANLEQTVIELPRTLRAARPALSDLNAAFPPLRRFVRDLRPAVATSGPTIDAALPFVRESRHLVSPSELRGLTFDLRDVVPSLGKLNRTSISLFKQVRPAASCQNEVVLPWSHDTVPDANSPSKGQVFQESVKGLPGLGEESRTGDANGQFVRVLAGNGTFTYAFGNDALGLPRFGITNFPLLGANPPKADRPPIRYDVPCETQQPPDLRTNPGQPLPTASTGLLTPSDKALQSAVAYEAAAKIVRGQGHAAYAKTLLARALGIRQRNGLVGKRFVVPRGRGALQITDVPKKAIDAAGVVQAGGQR